MNIRVNATPSKSESSLDVRIEATDLAIKEIENEMECINNVLCSLKELRATAEQERLNGLRERIKYLETKSYN